MHPDSYNPSHTSHYWDSTSIGQITNETIIVDSQIGAHLRLELERHTTDFTG